VIVLRSCGLAILRSGIKKYGALSRQEKLLFLEALFCQLWTGFIIKIVPFKYIPRFYAERIPDLKFKIQDSINNEYEVVGEVKKAIERAGIISPWKNRCLVESLAARCMLNKRKIASRISLGVAHDQGKKLVAHAWIRAGDTEIVAERGDYHEMYLF
jgi:hypothetical protein